MRSRHFVLSATLAVYAGLLCAALLAPTSDQQAGLVRWLAETLHQLGLPAFLTSFQRLEVIMNAVIIAPVTFLASMLRPARSWRDWTAFGFAASLTVETIQLLLLPNRHASFSDVVANTLGALSGAVFYLVVVWFATRPGTRRVRSRS